MKKLVRFTLVLIGVIILGWLIVALIEPREIAVSRSIVIKAPAADVFEQVVKFRNWPNWSPWYKMDSGRMKITYNGTDGTLGSGYHWEGTENTGSGDMENTGRSGTQMNFLMTFIKPYSFATPGSLKVTDTAGMAKVTWSCVVKMSFPMNASFCIMNWDKLMGGDFENGLANMKQYAESHVTAQPSTEVEIKEVDYPAHLFEGFRKTVAWGDINKFCMESFGTLGNGMRAKINGAATGLYYTWDTATKTTDMVAAFPAYDTTVLVPQASFIHVATSKAYMAVCKGGPSSMPKYNKALLQYTIAKGKKEDLVIEEYAISDHQEPDSNKWVTNIYYLVH